MNCLDSLVKCRFLKNIGSELIKASRIVKDGKQSSSKQKHPAYGYKPCTKKEAKKIYDYYMKHYGFASMFDDIDAENIETTYYLQNDNIVWIACRQVSAINQIKLESMYMNGDIPLYQGRQYIQNKLYHVLMFDLTFHVPPITTN